MWFVGNGLFWLGGGTLPNEVKQAGTRVMLFSIMVGDRIAARAESILKNRIP